MKPSKLLLVTLLPLALSACSNLSSISSETPPVAFHDTRFQYALLAGDRAMLAKDFDMKLPPSWVERAVAGMVLPFTVASEAAFFPVTTAIKAYAPEQEYSHSGE